MEKDRGTERGEPSGEAAKDVSDEKEGARHHHQPLGRIDYQGLLSYAQPARSGRVYIVAYF